MKKQSTYVLACLATIGLLAAATPRVLASEAEQIALASEASTTAVKDSKISEQKQVVAPALEAATKETTEYSEQEPVQPLAKQDDQKKASESLNRTVQPRAPAEGQDVSGNITEVTIDNGSELHPGDTVNVKIKFDEHHQKIHQGDTITVKWPNSGTAFGNGYVKEIPLTVNGVSGSISNGAEFQVQDDCAVIRFTNPLIDQLKNVKGWATFSIKTNNSSTSDAGFTISGGDQASVPVTVKGVTETDDSQGETVFYDKRGDMQPDDTDHVRWFLCVNNNKKPVTGSVQIEDQLQPGQSLDLNSFNFYFNDEGRASYSSIDEFLKQNPSARFVADAEKGHLSITLPQELISGRNLNIWYKTSVDDYNRSTFDNESTITYQEEGRPQVTESHNRYTDHSVKNVIIDGAASGDNNRVTVKVNKVWQDDQAAKRPAQIAVQLYANGHPSGEPIFLSSENNWSYMWSNLLDEVKPNQSIVYSVQEVNVPEGYKSAVTGENNNFTITNTFIPVKPTEEVKHWEPLIPAKKPSLSWKPLTPSEKANLKWLTWTMVEKPSEPSTSFVPFEKQKPNVQDMVSGKAMPTNLSVKNITVGQGKVQSSHNALPQTGQKHYLELLLLDLLAFSMTFVLLPKQHLNC